ncbi:MAG: gluconolactonase [Gemmatimonadetes bacterium]|nr:gluconolactonase [Gemmatimonadota bacterium]HCK09478.1 gluconolactonase [Candidatus Latescibacterota bacterium]
MCEGHQITQISTGCHFTEGPASDSEGNLFFSDSPNNRIMVLRAEGATEIWCEASGRANGMNFDPEGRLVACCAQGEGGLRAVVRFDKDGEYETLASKYQGKRLNSPNDLCFDPDGRIYFTDPRYGDKEDCEQDRQAVYRIEDTGELTRVIDDVETPNGILMTPDGQTIYLVDNNPEDWGARTLLAYGLTDEGEWLRTAEVYDFSPGRGGDGMVLDRAGNVYLTAGDGESGGVYVFSDTGEHLKFIQMPETPTNCTFGGTDLKTLCVTAMTSVYSIKCLEPGYLAFPQ